MTADEQVRATRSRTAHEADTTPDDFAQKEATKIGRGAMRLAEIANLVIDTGKLDIAQSTAKLSAYVLGQLDN
jgi:hypothetical protein